jgi:CRP-like cAMP-binding protein
MPREFPLHVAVSPLARRARNGSDISEQDRSILARLDAKSARYYPADTKLASEGAPIRYPFVIRSGWGCHSRILGDGRRQITSILLPGNLVGFGYRSPSVSLSTLCSLTPMSMIDATDLLPAWRAQRDSCGICKAISAALTEDEYFLTSHVVRLGRQTALERMAHLFLELQYRLSWTGSMDDAFVMPLTQDILGDVLGLSVVHVNRTLQYMRREQLIELSRTRLRVIDVDALTSLAEFKPPPSSSALAVGTSGGDTSDAQRRMN